MRKIKDAREILCALALPPAQRNERSALTLLALANMRPRGRWTKAERPLLRIWDIMRFMREHYDKDYAANTRETIRRQTIHQFEHARIIDRNPDDPSRPKNSGKNVYALTDNALGVVRLYGTPRFDSAVAGFINRFGSLQTAYEGKRAAQRVPLQMPDGSTVHLSPGSHNKLQVAVITGFGPRFAPGAMVLYVGDTAKKHVVFERDQIARLKFRITKHDKLPDVVLFCKKRNWLFLIEAVTTHGPVSAKRHHEIEAMLDACTADRIYVTAFPDMRTFRKYAGDIAWETEVWIAENPDHLIHFNGPRFLGPYKRRQKS